MACPCNGRQIERLVGYEYILEAGLTALADRFVVGIKQIKGGTEMVS